MADNTETNDTNEKKGMNFVEQIVYDDLQAGKNDGRLNTRFPPEPNGYLHIGHAKAICMDFGIAEKFGGTCNLRFDDTNPVKEDVEYVDSIREDIHWLGFDWGDREYYASDYFPQLYALAERLIREGKAYVDDQSSEEIAAQKGSPTVPGINSPYRDRTPEENLDLFHRMNAGEFEEGSRVLRAKIDMASDNMHFRDPIMYRIIKTPHHRTGTQWKVYPMYDFAHGQSDFFEGVTHSICTLEFVPHRPLYEYFVKELAKDGNYCPRQIEFNRLNLTYTVMSKRKLRQLVMEGLVAGWDDPRMPTISGMRRRGFTPTSIRNFIDTIGYTKYEALNSVSLLEFVVREDLNRIATRVMAVLNPVKVIITNYPEGKVEMVQMDNNPEQEGAGTHSMPFCREILIEREDFMENPPKKFFRLSPGKEVRLRYAYFMKCDEVVKDSSGNMVKLICSIDRASRGGNSPDGRKVKSTIHWVDASAAKKAKVRLFENLFTREDMSDLPEGSDFKEFLNPNSVVECEALVEPSLMEAKAGEHIQFERNAYFMPDSKLSTPGNPVFNRTVTLKDSYGK